MVDRRGGGKEEGRREGGGGRRGGGEERAREGAQVENFMIGEVGWGNRATFTTAYLMSSSLGRGICCKVDANCLTLSSSRGDCCHSNQRRFGASEVRSGCPGGRTDKLDNPARHGFKQT